MCVMKRYTIRVSEDTDVKVRKYADGVGSPSDNAAVVALVHYGLRYIEELEPQSERGNAGRRYPR